MVGEGGSSTEATIDPAVQLGHPPVVAECVGTICLSLWRATTGPDTKHEVIPSRCGVSRTPTEMYCPSLTSLCDPTNSSRVIKFLGTSGVNLVYQNCKLIFW